MSTEDQICKFVKLQVSEDEEHMYVVASKVEYLVTTKKRYNLLNPIYDLNSLRS